MWRRRVPTRYRLWAALSLALFVAAGCVNWVPEGKSAPYWAQWAIFLSRDYRGTAAADFRFALAGWGLLLAAPSALLGWVAQAVVGVVAAGAAPPRVAEPGAAADTGGRRGSS